jgi:hypothetical protein
MTKLSFNKKLNFAVAVEIEDIILGVVITCAIVLIILVAMKFKNNSSKEVVVKHIDVNDTLPINYANPALSHPTKSVDGEHQFSEDMQWKSQPSKCFDCEAQLEATCGPSCAYNANKQKTFNN